MYAYIHVCMGHRNINISDEVYNLLTSLKFPGESFNSLLMRTVGKKKHKGVDFSKYHGKLQHVPKEEWKKIDDELKTMWKTWKTA